MFKRQHLPMQTVALIKKNKQNVRQKAEKNESGVTVSTSFYVLLMYMVTEYLERCRGDKKK